MAGQSATDGNRHHFDARHSGDFFFHRGIGMRGADCPARRPGATSSVSSARLWLLFGAFCGLALLSKYTTVLLPCGILLWVILSPVSRRHLRQPWIYLAAILALLIFSPTIWWNYRHQWASFLFQFHHGLSDSPAEATDSGIVHGILLICRNLLLYVGGQALIWTPVLFVIGLVILFQEIPRLLRLKQVDRLLLISAVFPLGFFGAASAHKLGEVNWPAFSYVPLSLHRAMGLPNEPARADTW